MDQAAQQVQEPQVPQEEIEAVGSYLLAGLGVGVSPEAALEEEARVAVRALPALKQLS